MNKNQFNIGLYIRTEQIDSKYIDMQLSKITDYINIHYKNCKRKYYIDEGYSGRTFERPEFNEMINDYRNKKIDIILCTDISKFSRGNLPSLIKLIKDNDIVLKTIDDSLDTSKKDFLYIINVIMNHYYKDMVIAGRKVIK